MKSDIFLALCVRCALAPRHICRAARMADLPEPFLPLMKFTCLQNGEEQKTWNETPAWKGLVRRTNTGHNLFVVPCAENSSIFSCAGGGQITPTIRHFVCEAPQNRRKNGHKRGRSRNHDALHPKGDRDGHETSILSHPSSYVGRRGTVTNGSLSRRLMLLPILVLPTGCRAYTETMQRGRGGPRHKYYPGGKIYTLRRDDLNYPDADNDGCRYNTTTQQGLAQYFPHSCECVPLPSALRQRGAVTWPPVAQAAMLPCCQVRAVRGVDSCYKLLISCS